jgi:hypothetical protein
MNFNEISFISHFHRITTLNLNVFKNKHDIYQPGEFKYVHANFHTISPRGFRNITCFIVLVRLGDDCIL